MATKDTDPVVPDTQPRTSQGDPLAAPTNASDDSHCGAVDPFGTCECVLPTGHAGVHQNSTGSIRFTAPNERLSEAGRSTPATSRSSHGAKGGVSPPSTGHLSFPYTTPVPAPTTNGANGFRWCHECQSVADVAGHECASAVARALASPAAFEHMAADLDHWVNIANANEARAELAESLLCTMAFDHCRDELHCVAEYGPGCPPVEWFENNCGRPGCVFCDAERAYDAARGGGR